VVSQRQDKGPLYAKAYRAWRGIRWRCSPNAKNRSYTDYVARGIKVCERWSKFDAFFEDMGLPPTLEHQIDRKDNDGNYEPGNCRWATRVEQMSNRRTTHLLHYEGETHTVTEWADLLGINRHTLRNRIKAGWSIERVVTAPVRSWSWNRTKNAPRTPFKATRMIRQEQRRFVRELITNIKRDVINSITRGRVPPEWDGLELRQLLADKFQQSVLPLTGDRKKAYENTVLTNPNL
jgi:hypothetical protein